MVFPSDFNPEANKQQLMVPRLIRESCQGQPGLNRTKDKAPVRARTKDG